MFTNIVKKGIGLVLLLTVVGSLCMSTGIGIARAVEGADNTTPPAETGGGSNPGIIESAVLGLADSFMKQSADLTIRFAGFFTWMASSILDFSVRLSVLEMGTNVKQLTGIEIGWRAVRDVSNIIFIFVLLYIAIGTILQLSSTNARALLPKVIIVALLINFSLFFSQIVIDASNRLTLEFYDSAGIGKQKSFSTMLLTSSRVGTIYDINTYSNGSNGAAIAGVTGAGGATRDRTITGVLAERAVELMILAAAGSIFLFVLAFIFFAASYLLAARFIILVFLMMLAPLAFASMVLPNTRQYAQKWWSMLFKQAFFAPLFFMLIWMSLNIINSEGFQKVLPVDPNDTFAQIILGKSLSVVTNYIIVIGFLVAALIISQSLGAYGANTMVRWGGNLRKLGVRAGTLPFRFAGRIGKEVAGAAVRDEVNTRVKPMLKKFNVVTTKARDGRYGRVAQVLASEKNPLARGTQSTLQNVVNRKYFGQSISDVEKAEQAYRAAGEKDTRKSNRQAAIDEYKKLREENPEDFFGYIKSDDALPEDKDAYARFEKAARSMSNKEVTDMDVDDLKTIAHALTDEHMKAIQKDEDKTDEEKAAIWDARFAEVTHLMDKISEVEGRADITEDERKDMLEKVNKDIRAFIKQLTKNDIDNLNQEIVTDMRFVSNLGSKNVEDIMKSNLVPSIKGEFKKKRNGIFEAVVQQAATINLDNPAEATSPNLQAQVNNLKTAFGSVKPSEIAGLGKSVFGDADKNAIAVLGLNSNILNAMYEDGMETELQKNILKHINTIKTYIDNGELLIDAETERDFDKLRDWLLNSPNGKYFGS